MQLVKRPPTPCQASLATATIMLGTCTLCASAWDGLSISLVLITTALSQPGLLGAGGCLE
jgi:hypothetical protein